MPTVKMLNPEGQTIDVDPDKYDIQAMMSDGFTRVPVPERDPNLVMVAAHQRYRPGMRLKKKEPWIVSQLPNAGGLAGNIAGRGIGGAAGVGSGALTLGSTSIPGAVVGQQLGGTTGAALGGAAGEGLRQVIDAAMGYGIHGEPETLEDRAKAIAGAAGTQAAYSVGGELLGQGARVAGKGLMGAALKVTPEVAQTALREGIAATGAGLERAVGRLKEYGSTVRQMLSVSTRNGVRFDPIDVLQGVSQSLRSGLAADQTGNAAEHSEIYKQLMRTFLNGHATFDQYGAMTGVKPMTPLEMQTLKKQAQAMAKPLYEKIAKKEVLQPLEKASLEYWKAVASYAQNILEQTTPDLVDPVTKRVVSLAEVNHSAGNLKILKEALAPLVGRNIGTAATVTKRVAGPAAVGATVGALQPGTAEQRAKHAFEYGLIGGAATSPQVMSRVGLALNNPMLYQMLTQAPRAVGVLAEEGR